MQEQNPSVHSMCVRRTHILMDCPDAAQSQYLLGLKTRALMISPPGRVYRCFPSLRSHSIALPSYRGQTELNTHTQTHSSKLKLKLLSKKNKEKKKPAHLTQEVDEAVLIQYTSTSIGSAFIATNWTQRNTNMNRPHPPFPRKHRETRQGTQSHS